MEKLIEKISVEYNGIMESYFKEHYREVVTDPILCDYYVEWCLKNKKYRWISELEKEPAANPISLVYAKWVKSYRRGRYRRAVSYMERYRDMAEQLEVKNIRKSRSFLVDDITNRFMDYRVFKEIYRADSLPLMEALYNLGRFKAEYRTYYWMLLNQRHREYTGCKGCVYSHTKEKAKEQA